jgi:hypothetical protein
MVTSNTLWTAEIDQNWLSITVGNDKVIITADANTTSTTRSAIITISATGTANQVVNVSQTGSTPFLKLDTTIVKFDKNDVLTKTVNVTSNGIFTALSDKDWVTVLVNGKTLIISASKNDGDSSRTATITVQTPGVAPRTITVTQSATKTSADDVPVVVLEVFPNPTTESFAITGFEGVATVMLGSVTKPEIFKTRVSAGECIDVSSLAQGEYVVRIYTANTLLVTKLIKQ